MGSRAQDDWRAGRDLRVVLGAVTFGALGYGVSWWFDLGTPESVGLTISAALIWAFLYALQGSLLQDRVVRQSIEENVSACVCCGTTRNLRVIDFSVYWGILVIAILHRRVTKFCPHCGRRALGRAIAITLVGSLLCPGLWIWALLSCAHKAILMARLGHAAETGAG